MSVPSCAKDCGALRAGDQRGERGEAPEGRRVGGAAHVLSGAGAAGAVSRCCGVLWAVGLGKFLCEFHRQKKAKTWGKWFISVYYILHIMVFHDVHIYITYNYINIFFYLRYKWYEGIMGIYTMVC